MQNSSRKKELSFSAGVSTVLLFVLERFDIQQESSPTIIYFVPFVAAVVTYVLYWIALKKGFSSLEDLMNEKAETKRRNSLNRLIEDCNTLLANPNIDEAQKEQIKLKLSRAGNALLNISANTKKQ